MPWFKVDDRFPEHPKLAQLEHDPRLWAEAVALWVSAGCYASGNLTDGEIPKARLHRITPLGQRAVRAAEALVDCGLWEITEDGYRFHDFLDHNPSKEEVLASRANTSEARSKAGRRGAESRWGADGKPDGKAHGKRMANAMAKPWQSDSKPNGKTMAPARPDPTHGLTTNHYLINEPSVPDPPPPVDVVVFGSDPPEIVGKPATEAEFLEALASGGVALEITQNAKKALKRVRPTLDELRETVAAVDKSRLGEVGDRGAWVLGILRQRRSNPKARTWVDATKEWLAAGGTDADGWAPT